MRVIWRRIINEPAIALAIPTVLFATAAGVWASPTLAFLAAASAGLGSVFVRSNVTADNPRYWNIDDI